MFENLPYLTQEEIELFDKLLEHTLSDTYGCWKRTRLNGMSASLACEGNISIPLLKHFDKLRKDLKK